MLHPVSRRGSEPEDRSRRTTQVGVGPNRWSKLQKGLARAAFEALIYRLRPEGSFPLLPTQLGHF